MLLLYTTSWSQFVIAQVFVWLCGEYDQESELVFWGGRNVNQKLSGQIHMETFPSKSGEGMWLKIMKKMELICVIIASVFSSILVIYCLFVYEHLSNY